MDTEMTKSVHVWGLGGGKVLLWAEHDVRVHPVQETEDELIKIVGRPWVRRADESRLLCYAWELENEAEAEQAVTALKEHGDVEIDTAENEDISPIKPRDKSEIKQAIKKLIKTPKPSDPFDRGMIKGKLEILKRVIDNLEIETETELCDKVWYSRHQVRCERIEWGEHKVLSDEEFDRIRIEDYPKLHSA
jgi:hypothetical protein